jgi:hypothetical protein
MLSIREIAARHQPASLAAAKRLLKEAGIKQSLAPQVMAELASVEKARSAKRAARFPFRRMPACPPVRLPEGTPAERIERLRKDMVLTAFVTTFRQPAHGDLSVVLTADPALVGVRQIETADWDIYAKSYTKGPARVLDTTVTAPAAWRVRVARKGLAVLDGMMTLDAAPIEGAPVGVSLYAARWVEQGRGTAVRTVDGFIAAGNGHSYHGASAEKALAGLRRKIDGAAWADKLRIADLEELVARIPQAVVRLSDARAIGACEYGIRSWCARTGISYEAGQATVAEVYAAYQASPAPEARFAILYAARRARRAA